MTAVLIAFVRAAPDAQAQGVTPAPPQSNPAAPMYQQKGEQDRIYNFPGTGESIPYRLFVPATWTPATKLPMLVTLRAGNTVVGPFLGGHEVVLRCSKLCDRRYT